MRPITLGLQEHRPPYLSHSSGLFDPTELQLHAEITYKFKYKYQLHINGLKFFFNVNFALRWLKPT